MSVRLGAAALFVGFVAWTGPVCAQTQYAADVKVAPDFHDAGRAPAQTPVHLAVTLSYEHETQLDALIDQQTDPRSPNFRHYISNAQFAAYFAPSQAKAAAVERVLTAAGFRITSAFANRTLLDATGPAVAAERLFATEIHRGVQTGHGERYVNVREAIMPPALRGAVVGVSGFDNLISFRTRYHRGPSRQAIGPPLMGPNGGYGPLAFAQGYDELVQQGFDGTGRSIANIMAGDIDDTDLATYLSYFDIQTAGPIVRVPVDGGNIGHYDVETTLDIEAMSGTAPGAQVYLYSFPEFTDADAEDAYNTVVDDDVVDAANSSWGGCEADKNQQLGYSFALASNKIFKQGAAKGITFPIATGDQGWTTCHIHGEIDETTADSDPYALAVGGTTLTVDDNGNWVSEKGWRGSAGGVSVVFPIPKYQRGIRHIVGAGRNIPDVALDADPNTGMAEYLRGQWFEVGGTSMASPLWVGLEGQIDQFLGTRVGFVNPLLYPLSKTSAYATTMHDITRGDNGGYRSGRGFDQVTGLGSPIVAPLAQELEIP